ncbi:MAG: 50S ribosomal protein L27 [Candidatus Pacebacteria bacterium]|nr:50S ribosomal protein L27 [Candidatus Paceibacterota bacterium]
MAHTKSLGTTKNARDSEAKRLGVKKQDGQPIRPGEIILRQRGSKYVAGKNVKVGGDDTIYSMKSGKVKFRSSKKTRFDGSTRYIKIVDVITV